MHFAQYGNCIPMCWHKIHTINRYNQSSRHNNQDRKRIKKSSENHSESHNLNKFLKITFNLQPFVNVCIWLSNLLSVISNPMTCNVNKCCISVLTMSPFRVSFHFTFCFAGWKYLIPEIISFLKSTNLSWNAQSTITIYNHIFIHSFIHLFIYSSYVRYHHIITRKNIPQKTPISDSNSRKLIKQRKANTNTK